MHCSRLVKPRGKTAGSAHTGPCPRPGSGGAAACPSRGVTESLEPWTSRRVSESRGHTELGAPSCVMARPAAKVHGCCASQSLSLQFL